MVVRKGETGATPVRLAGCTPLDCVVESGLAEGDDVVLPERWRGRLLRRRTAALARRPWSWRWPRSPPWPRCGSPGDVLNPVDGQARGPGADASRWRASWPPCAPPTSARPPVTGGRVQDLAPGPRGLGGQDGPADPRLRHGDACSGSSWTSRPSWPSSAKKVEQKEVDLRLKLLEIEQQVAQAEADLGKAQLKAEVPPELQERVELEKARLDHKGRQRDLENLQAERRATQSLGESELRSLRNQRDRARGAGGGAAGRHREDDGQGAAGRDRRLPHQLARREEEGRRLHVVRGDRARPARPHRDARGRPGGRGGRRPGGGRPEGHASGSRRVPTSTCTAACARSGARCARSPGATR